MASPRAPQREFESSLRQEPSFRAGAVHADAGGPRWGGRELSHDAGLARPPPSHRLQSPAGPGRTRLPRSLFGSARPARPADLQRRVVAPPRTARSAPPAPPISHRPTLNPPSPTPVNRAAMTASARRPPVANTASARGWTRVLSDVARRAHSRQSARERRDGAEKFPEVAFATFFVVVVWKPAHKALRTMQSRMELRLATRSLENV
ncbi:Protein of unknown function [Gryllus bimaculatus]|nr:Protein of unknown function [Gryllus bimaculatus]